MKRFFFFILNITPNIFISYVFSYIFTIFFISFPYTSSVVKPNFYLLQIIFFLISLKLFLKYKNSFYLHGKNVIYEVNYPLLFFGFIIIIYRSVTYAHAIDDFVLHMIGGWYSLDMWTGKNLFPYVLNYLYPIMPLSYYPFLDLLGIRITLLIFYISALIWYLNLNYRYNYFFFKNNTKKYFYLNFLFIYLFFYPPLILTHVTFMSDFFVLLFVLEGFLLFLNKDNKNIGIILMLIGALIKQSLGLFILPFIFYFFIKNFKVLISKKIFWLFILLILPFFIRNYLEIKNPFGDLYNNVFKSPIFEAKYHREYDLRWGAFSISERIYWPFIAMFTNSFNEVISLTKIAKILYPIILFIPYSLSLYFFINKKKFIFFIIFFSFLMWSWESGYGRYVLVVVVLSWIIILYEFKKKFKPINEIIGNLILIILSIFLFPLIRNDYGMRNFILTTFYPPRVNRYDYERFIRGLKYIGRDRYIDIYENIKNNFNNIKAIVILDKGLSYYYAFLGSRFNKIPVYSYLDLERIKIIKKSKLSNIFKKNIDSLLTANELLVLSTKDYHETIKKTWINRKYTCKVLSRKKRADQFIHENYFDYVVEYRCEKVAQ